MTPTDPAFLAIKNLSDAQALALDPATQADLSDKLMMSRASGVALGLPSQVDLAQQPSVPFVWGHQVSSLRRWEVSPKLNARLLVTQIQAESVRVGSLIIPHGKRFSPKPFLSQKGPQPAGDDLGMTAGVDKASFAGIFGTAPDPGRYAVTVLYHDWSSETSTLQVGAAGASPVPLDERQARGYAGQAARQDENGFPNYEPHAGVGALPEKGLIAELQRDASGRPIAAGQLRLAKDEVFVVDSSLKGKTPDAFVSLHIIALTLDEVNATTSTLVVPLDEFSGEFVAQFAVDLSPYFQGSANVVYLVVGSHKTGPLGP